MDELQLLRSATNAAPEPDLATLSRARVALDARIDGHGHMSSLRRRTTIRLAIGLGAFVVAGGVSGAAVIQAYQPIDVNIGTAPKYQDAFLGCMADHGWHDVVPGHPYGPNYVSMTYPDLENGRFTDDLDACRATVAHRFGVSIYTVTNAQP